MKAVVPSARWVEPHPKLPISGELAWLIIQVTF
jgi:hypothetical protein